MCYPCDAKNALQTVSDLYKEFTEGLPAKEREKLLQVLVGCKKDVQCKENRDGQGELDKWAKGNGFVHVVTSSKHNMGVDAVFEAILKHATEKILFAGCPNP